MVAGKPYRKRNIQIAVYAPRRIVQQLRREARRRRRKLGPTVLEIVREYFHTQKGIEEHYLGKEGWPIVAEPKIARRK
jgi:hypothetical protein